MKMKNAAVGLFFTFLFLFLSIKQTYAVKFDLVAPSGTLTRGQDVVFTINMDTEGASVTTIQTGLTYDTAYLQYESVAAGAATDSVTADTSTYGTGKVLLSGTKTAGFNGNGVFATVTFKLVAQNAGSTEICTLWVPNTPTVTGAPTPTTVVGATSSPTAAPQPTALPTTGITDSRNSGVVLAVVFLLAAGGIYSLSQKQKYTQPKKQATLPSKAKK